SRSSSGIPKRTAWSATRAEQPSGHSPEVGEADQQSARERGVRRGRSPSPPEARRRPTGAKRREASEEGGGWGAHSPEVGEADQQSARERGVRRGRSPLAAGGPKET